jgi:hypothetical protein
MISKTIGALFLLIVCIMFFPLAFAILGGVFGIIAGVFGAVFGGIIGVVGGVIGAIFGIFESLFESIFHWPFNFFGCNNVFTLGLIVVVVALAVRARRDTK